MTKTLYEYKVGIIYNGESTAPDLFSGYMKTYKDALNSATELADAIAPEQTIISIKKKVVEDKCSCRCELETKCSQLENRLEVSEKEHYRTLEQLRIATGALRETSAR